ncbi:MAG: 30S ribosomal protein S17 [Deltaproteobacteria bacterium]|nr:30S ribosomal protein S17 [Deltaproteobacteria bacterium]
MERQRGNRKTLVGVVKSAGKMDKTVSVEVERKFKHPIFKKYIKKHKKYLAHDEQNQYQEGDKVKMVESKPISKNKRWVVQELIERKPRI